MFMTIDMKDITSKAIADLSLERLSTRWHETARRPAT